MSSAGPDVGHLLAEPVLYDRPQSVSPLGTDPEAPARIEVITETAVDPGVIEAQLRLHPHVKDVAVLEIDGERRERQLIAYVAGDLAGMKTLTRAESKFSDAGIVDCWHRLHEIAYPNAYNNLEVRAELDSSLRRIAALRPARVLEIGCGDGRLLKHLAPRCAWYVGTVFSETALTPMREWLSRRGDMGHVRLLQCPANDLLDMQSDQFDTIILDSVVQYFPHVEYLSIVLQQALRLLESGGRIFIGDVRYYGLLPTFQSAAQLTMAPSSLRVEHLRRRISRAITQESRLLIDPQWFHSIPGVQAIDVQLRRGDAQNELTGYRYDVVLQTDTAHRIGIEPAKPLMAACRGQRELNTLLGILAERKPRAVYLTGLLSSRLAKDKAAQTLIETANANVAAGTLRAQLVELELDTIDPETVWQWGEAQNYHVRVDRGPAQSPERLSVYLWESALGAPLPQILAEIRTSASLQQYNLEMPGHKWANDPLENILSQQLIPRLRVYLAERFPDHMVPSAWTILRELPLTSAGTLDRSAL